ncbi:putative Fungal-specific transcription factor domain-containing protein [Seiridium cardinale]|uniref:Fungal-specific transcription factor domain-containing protein n=1 Tax=Seiridium cardinale TaxID=138064 RepID=A0ABR2XG79_9PEZI
MSPTPPIALILGAGSNVGHHVGRAFAAKGYRIVATARSVKEADSSSDQTYIQSDLSNPAAIAELFATVKTQLGHPSVVVYNAAAVTLNDPKNPFSISLSDFQRDFAVNTTSVFAAAQQAVLGFQELPESAARTFIYTGNCLNVSPILPLTDAGVGKSATAHLIHSASEAFKDRGFKFYYADERNADGSPAYSKVDGPAHGKFYTELAEGAEQGPWQQTFVKDLSLTLKRIVQKHYKPADNPITKRTWSGKANKDQPSTLLRAHQRPALVTRLAGNLRMDNTVATRENKRSRHPGNQKFITRACDACRKKKIRCEPTKDKCLQCIKFKSRCHFTPISGSRKIRKPAENEYIIELEERVKEMEGQLQIAYELNFQAGRPPHQPTNPGNILHDLLSGNHQIQDPNLAFWNEPSPNLMDLVVPQRNIVSSFPRYLDLPSKSSALILIEEGFRSFNRYFPIFDEQKFIKSFDARYSAAGFQDLAWWASVNVALSMGHTFRAIRTSQSKHDMALSYGYIQNVLGVVSQLIALPDSLAAIQSLLGTILILEGTPKSQMCPVLMATAMGMAQALGLHRRDRDPPGLSLLEIEERRNVFWIAYWMEKNISCLRRQASVQDDDDIDVELPTGTVSEPHLLSHGPATINILNSRIGLAIIQGQIYKRLFSVQAERQCEAQRAAAALELSGLLACWRASVPFDFEESSMTSLCLPLPEDVLQIIILHTVYANSVITVDRHIPQRGNPSAGPADIYTYTLPSESVCLIDSRKAIQLLQKIPRGKYAFIWLLVGSFFEAVTVLLHNVIVNPFHTRARSDILLIEPFLELLEVLDDDGDNVELQRMRKECNSLIQNAIAAVEGIEYTMIVDY